MSAKLDEFKEFVKKHPLVKQKVLNVEKTWQQLYEDYVILGESSFEDEKEKEVEKMTNIKTDDLIKTIVGYVKKIDPDQVTKTVTSIQKVIELIGGLGVGASSKALGKKSTGDPLFDKRFDEWF